MSFTGPGCAACAFEGRVPVWDDAARSWDHKPCDACGGLSQFRHRDEAVALVPAVSVPAAFAYAIGVARERREAAAAADPVDAYLAADNALLDALRRGDVRDEYHPLNLARHARLDELRAAVAERERLRAQLDTLASSVRREHNARLAWLATLPDGACPNPPPRVLLDAERATREALREVL